MKQLAPICLVAYKRPYTTWLVLDALAANPLAQQSHLIVYIDAPKPNAPEQVIKDNLLVKAILRSRQWCKSVEIVERSENLGVIQNVLDAITQTVHQYGKVIFLEDDVVVSPGYLAFMNKMLDWYEKDGRVMMISGYTHPIAQEDLPPYFFIKASGTPWGFATWKRAWQHFEGNPDTLVSAIQAKQGAGQFNFHSPYIRRFQALKALAKGTCPLQLWFLRFTASIFIQEGYGIYPSKSLVTNIGNDAAKSNPLDFSSFNIPITSKLEAKKKLAVVHHKIALERLIHYIKENGKNEVKLFLEADSQ